MSGSEMSIFCPGMHGELAISFLFCGLLVYWYNLLNLPC